MDNQDMHPSVIRLLNCAREATAGTSKPIHSTKELRLALGASSATLTNWKTRATGVPLQAAVQAQDLWGCNSTYIREGTGAIWLQGREPLGAALPRNVGSLSNPSASRPIQPTHTAESPFTNNLQSDTKVIRAPVIAWASLVTLLMKTNRDWPEEAFVNFTAVTERVSECVKAVTVLESKIPTISPGDRVAIDPEVTPWDDCVVVVKAASGRVDLRRYRSLADGGWEAVLPDEPPLDSVRHGLTLVGVVVALNKMKF